MSKGAHSGRDLVLEAIRGRETPRVPWVPFVGCHAGRLLERSAADYLRDADLIVEGVTQAARLYRADGIPVAFDLQVEAEALGCGIEWADENPPAVRAHLSKDVWSALTEPLQLNAARIPIVLDAAARLRKALPDVALYGLVTGPFTLAMHLVGAPLFMELYDDPEGVHRLLGFCRQVAGQMAGAYVERGCDVVGVVDPMTSQIGPEQFREFVAEPCRELFAQVRELGAAGSFFVCGHAQKNIAAMAETAPDNVSIDENIPLDYVRDECLPRGISFGGNMRLTTVMLMGSPEDNAAHAAECLRIGGGRGFLLSPGCDMPYATPQANVEAIAAVVHDPYQREVAERMLDGRDAVQAVTLDMSEYGRTDKVIVDVITLDSEACAPCQYMVEAVKDISPEFQDLVIWREHKIKQRESVAFMMSLFVRNIPTICIDGRITFVSTIPRREELAAAIQRRINEKLKLKIRRQRAKLTLFCREGDAACDEAWQNVQRAILETGADVETERVMDAERALRYGAVSVPAIVLTTHQLKADGRPPEVAAIREWLKALS